MTVNADNSQKTFWNNFRWRQVMYMALTVAFLLLPLIILRLDPDVEHIEQEQSFCPHKFLTGLPCPGCGIIKSQIALYQGEFCQSTRYHAFGIPVTLGLYAAVIIILCQLLKGKPMKMKWLYNIRTAYAVAILWGGYHLVRLVCFISTHSFSQILHESIWA